MYMNVTKHTICNTKPEFATDVISGKNIQMMDRIIPIAIIDRYTP